METTNHTRGNGWLRRSVLLSFVVAALSLSLVVTGAAKDGAEAYAVPPVPILVGETLATPAAETLAGGVCVGTAVCGLVVGTTALAVAAYATRDTWIPVLKGVWNKAFGDGPSTNTCLSGTAQLVGGSITGQAVMSSCPYLGTNGYVAVRNGQCRTSAGAITTAGNTGTGLNKNGSNPWTQTQNWTVPICATGSTLVYAEWQLQISGSYLTGWAAIGTAVPDASASQTTTVTCMKPDGTTVTISGTQTGQTDQVAVPSCWQAVPNSYPTHVTISGGWPGAEKPKVDTNLSTGFTTNYPDCFVPSGGLSGACKVRVWINGSPCTVGSGHCPNWQTANADFGDQVECRWGSYVVQMGNCDLLKKAYQTTTGTQTLTTTTTQGVPTTADDPNATGNQTSSGSSFPSTGTNPGTGPDTGTQTDTNSSNCWGSGWSWNPVSWVYIPVKCALKWAFVPTSAPAFTDLANPIPAGWLPSIPSVSDTSCGVIEFPRLKLGFDNLEYGPSKIVDTCQPPWPDVRAFTYYGVLALVMIPLGFKAFNMVLSALGLYLGIETSVGGIGRSGTLGDGQDI